MRRVLSRSATGIIVGLASVVLCAGCGAQSQVEDAAASVGEKAVDKAVTEAVAEAGGVSGDEAEVEVDSDTGVISVDVDGKTLRMGEDLPLPADFPSSLPLPEGGHSINAVIAEQGVFEVTMFVDDGDLLAHEDRIRDSLVDQGYEIGATTEATVEGIDQRLVRGAGHGTDITVIFSSPWDKPSVHYSVKER